MRTSELKVSELKHNGTICFRVNFGVNNGGKHWFSTEAEAKAAIKAFKTQQKKVGELAGKVTPQQVARLIEAESLLEGSGIDVVDAAKLALAELAKHQTSETLGRALDEYYDHCQREHKKKAKDSPRKEPKHLWAFGQTRNLFQPLKNKLLSEITSDEIERTLDRKKPSQFNKHLAHLKSTFNYAKQKKWISENPISEIKKESILAREGRAYRPDEVKKFMQTLVAHDRDSIPYYALIFFAGIRPDTAFKLDWSAMNNGEQIQIKRTVSKTTKAFPVTITSTLQAWIDWWVAQGGTRTGPVHPKSAKTRTRNRARLCRLSKIEWIQDAPRRTFGTAHFLTHKSAAHAAGELGHMGGAEVFYSHYYDGTLSEKQAKEFWKILPPGEK
jgi:site-specific recombinase XerD